MKIKALKTQNETHRQWKKNCDNAKMIAKMIAIIKNDSQNSVIRKYRRRKTK